MKPFIPALTLIFLLSLAGGAGSHAADTYNPPAISEIQRMVSPLPWNFSLIQRDMTGTDFPFFTGQPRPASLTAYRFVSTESVAKTGQGRTFLRFDLFVGEFNSIKDTSLRFKQVRESANPDTGISYQWDLIARKGQFLYHLHADCLLAERYFDILRNEFLDMLSRHQQNNPILLFCRCGRGCS